jgi:DNA-binding beta-propeller fold protein YncE
VTELSPSGKRLGTFSVGLKPEGVAVSSSGQVWVANSGSNTVSRLS